MSYHNVPADQEFAGVGVTVAFSAVAILTVAVMVNSTLVARLGFAQMIAAAVIACVGGRT